MKAVELLGYGPAPELLRVNPEAEAPGMAPNDILVRVHAASVNPLDCKRRLGYGRHIYKAMGAAHFPATMGCDFSGVVERVGERITTFKPGDEVWGAQDPFRPGCQAEYVAIRGHDAARKPAGLSHVEAAALPYVALTAWSALVGKGGLKPGGAAGLRVLVHGGGGGVGGAAIQMLKAWGAWVTATASAGKLDLARGLGADEAIDYQATDFADVLRGFDLVLDTVGGAVGVRSLRVLKRGGRVVGLHSPLMPMTDKYGPRRGFSMMLIRTLVAKGRALMVGGSHRDAYFHADGAALAEIATLVEAGRLRPVVDRVLPVERAAEAYALVAEGHSRGKVVLSFE